MIVMTCLCKTSELPDSFAPKRIFFRETKILPINTLGKNVHKKKNPSARLRRRVSVVVCGLAMTFPNRKKIFEQNRLFLSLSLLSLVLSRSLILFLVSFGVSGWPSVARFFLTPTTRRRRRKKSSKKLSLM